MKKNLTKNLLLKLIFTIIMISVLSCSSEDNNESQTIPKSELIFTKISGDALYAHGDHFHGISSATEGEKLSIKFDQNGNAISEKKINLQSGAIYKIELKVWNEIGDEIQNRYIANKEVADNYKAFLVGGSLILNSNSETKNGAIFQPRELSYADDSAVSGKYETTGILAYFTLGNDNETGKKEMRYILRKLVSDEKVKIERTDWNRDDYFQVFSGIDELDLKFEIVSN